MKISICVPAYEMHGLGNKYLKELFKSIENQSHKNVEVIVADHSRDRKISRLCRRWASHFKLTYSANTRKRGNSSANMNHAIRRARGDLIKIMHQDDFFYHPDALKDIRDGLQKSKAQWGVCAFAHFREDAQKYFKFQIPYYQDRILRAVNTIGAPSALFFRRRAREPFDEKLIWMNDCEMAYRLFHKWGRPLVIKKTGIVIRRWEKQVANTLVNKKLQLKEMKYAAKKHNLS